MFVSDRPVCIQVTIALDDSWVVRSCGVGQQTPRILGVAGEA